LSDVLYAAGLKVAEHDGWETRGLGDVGPIKGVLCHHTAGPAHGNMPSLGTILNGRPDLRGPLAQLGLGRDGTYYALSAGLCQHAGHGSWRGITTGNTNFIGIEAENTGLSGDSPWPNVQMDAYHRGVAAILAHLNLTAECCAGHKEYALPVGRKDDPDFDMKTFRDEVAAHLTGNAPPPVLIPAREPASGAGIGRPTLRRGATGTLVRVIQGKSGVIVDGQFGPGTEAAVRDVQRAHQLVPDGIVGPATWKILDSM
jgi:peptidoglycan hydrolase-like protein with peptidoglycan-binding domain